MFIEEPSFKLIGMKSLSPTFVYEILFPMLDILNPNDKSESFFKNLILLV